jgi:hypothetical protein
LRGLEKRFFYLEKVIAGLNNSCGFQVLAGQIKKSPGKKCLRMSEAQCGDFYKIKYKKKKIISRKIAANEAHD